MKYLLAAAASSALLAAAHPLDRLHPFHHRHVKTVVDVDVVTVYVTEDGTHHHHQHAATIASNPASASERAALLSSSGSYSSFFSSSSSSSFKFSSSTIKSSSKPTTSSSSSHAVAASPKVVVITTTATAPLKTMSSSSIKSSSTSVKPLVLSSSSVAKPPTLTTSPTSTKPKTTTSASIKPAATTSSPVTVSSATATAQAVAATSTTTADSSTNYSVADSYGVAVVDQHNKHRANHSAPDCTWNATLASYAKQVASTCVFAHDLKPGGGGYGQNIAMSGSSVDISAQPSASVAAMHITNMWYNGEYANYAPYFDIAKGDSPPGSTIEGWGHLSQLIWGASDEIGCATVYCPAGTMSTGFNDWFTVCNYRGAGNVAGYYADQVKGPLGHATVSVSVPNHA